MRFRPAAADRSRMAVMAHALMLMEPPGGAAIAALNRFLAALDEPRRIDRDAHIGLAEEAGPFLERLEAAFGF